jgi:hypothetical protein
MVHRRILVTSPEEACEGAAEETGKEGAAEVGDPSSMTVIYSVDGADPANHGVAAIV